MVSRSEYVLPTVSCPACEYERHNSGSPRQITEFQYICAVCSTKWKEFDVAKNIYIGFAKNGNLGTDVADQPSHKTSNTYRVNSRKIIGASIFAMSFVVGVLLYALVFRSENISRPSLSKNLDQLVIQSVEIRPAYSAPKSAWIITARVENPSSNSMYVPEIHVQVGEPGNRGYIDHYYKPALQKLQPGANFKLRLAIRKTHARKSQISLAFSDQLNSGN